MVQLKMKRKQNENCSVNIDRNDAKKPDSEEIIIQSIVYKTYFIITTNTPLQR